MLYNSLDLLARTACKVLQRVLPVYVWTSLLLQHGVLLWPQLDFLRKFQFLQPLKNLTLQKYAQG